MSASQLEGVSLHVGKTRCRPQLFVGVAVQKVATREAREGHRVTTGDAFTVAAFHLSPLNSGGTSPCEVMKGAPFSLVSTLALLQWDKQH